MFIGKKRAAEVVLVLPRPNERVLVHAKGFYPSGTFRLLSGGVHHGEKVEDAAQREMLEETGLDTALTRFLGLIEYQFRCGTRLADFASFVFLAEETNALPITNDARERISEFRELEWNELARITDHLENLPDDWRDWGKFRAVAHRLVIEARAQGKF